MTFYLKQDDLKFIIREIQGKCDKKDYF